MVLGIILIVGLVVFSTVEVVALVRDIKAKKKAKAGEMKENEEK